ncbi:BQ5605_C010g06070 [Microbotryum silenes-dioicae]|uniref:BQ5605_C010g06070 protein n=1 Tax=Microbotryum silenes-dioicae TaxID=796604 RepID=A0A2X0LQE4_9BASI|nr:BQ5605_C010g06070 [Microbotryum silenes-dioicae]
MTTSRPLGKDSRAPCLLVTDLDTSSLFPKARGVGVEVPGCFGAVEPDSTIGNPLCLLSEVNPAVVGAAWSVDAF